MRCTNLQQISAADDFSKPLPIESHRKNNQPRVPKLLVNVLWFLGHVFLWLIHVNPTRWWVDLMEFRQKHQHVDFQKSFKVMAGWVVSIAYFDLQLGTIFHLSRTSCWRRTDLAWIFQQISQDGTGHVWTVVACASCAGSHGNHHGFAWQSRGNPKIESTGSFPLNHIKPLWILGAPFSDTPTLRFYTNHWQGNLMQSNSSCASKLEALKIRAERQHSSHLSIFGPSFPFRWSSLPRRSCLSFITIFNPRADQTARIPDPSGPKSTVLSIKTKGEESLRPFHVISMRNSPTTYNVLNSIRPKMQLNWTSKKQNNYGHPWISMDFPHFKIHSAGAHALLHPDSGRAAQHVLEQRQGSCFSQLSIGQIHGLVSTYRGWNRLPWWAGGLIIWRFFIAKKNKGKKSGVFSWSDFFWKWCSWIFLLGLSREWLGGMGWLLI